jgi:hypothetical protein
VGKQGISVTMMPAKTLCQQPTGSSVAAHAALFMETNDFLSVQPVGKADAITEVE